MNIPLPPASLWEQYSVIGILALILIVIGYLARRMFLDFVKWQDEQDLKKAEERKTQRLWQESQSVKAEDERVQRDQNWQAFFERINGENSLSINRLAEVHAKLVDRIDAMTQRMDAITVKLTEHDAWVKSNVGEAKPRAARGK